MNQFSNIEQVDGGPEVGSVIVVTLGSRIAAAASTPKNVLVDELCESLGIQPDELNINVALDLSNVTFIASMGPGSFLGLDKHLERTGGKLVLYQIPSAIREIFKVMQLDRVLTIKDTQAQAIASFQQEA